MGTYKGEGAELSQFMPGDGPEEPKTSTEEALDYLVGALKAAEAKHPGWPDDFLHGIAIITEEVGEAAQEAIEWTYRRPDTLKGMVLNLSRLTLELAQTGAVCLRMMIQIIEAIDTLQEESDRLKEEERDED